MTVEAMRAKISEAYDSDAWRNRVKIMEDRQVAAIYRNMRDRGRFVRRKRRRKGKSPDSEQISIFELLEGIKED